MLRLHQNLVWSRFRKLMALSQSSLFFVLLEKSDSAITWKVVILSESRLAFLNLNLMLSWCLFVCNFSPHLARPGVDNLDLPQGKWIVRSKDHPILSYNLDQQPKSCVVVDKWVGPNLAEEISRGNIAVGCTKVRPHLIKSWCQFRFSIWFWFTLYPCWILPTV